VYWYISVQNHILQIFREDFCNILVIGMGIFVAPHVFSESNVTCEESDMPSVIGMGILVALHVFCESKLTFEESDMPWWHWESSLSMRNWDQKDSLLK
jgi:hypothetical protein